MTGLSNSQRQTKCGRMTKLELTASFLASESSLRDFVALWESRRLEKAAWTHAAHIAVCAFYSAEFGRGEALRRMRAGIPLYNVAVGGENTEDSGYHETLTCLWAQSLATLSPRAASPRRTQPSARRCCASARSANCTKTSIRTTWWPTAAPGVNGCRPIGILSCL